MKNDVMNLFIQLVDIVMSLVLRLNDDWVLLQILRCGHLGVLETVLETASGQIRQTVRIHTMNQTQLQDTEERWVVVRRW
jgi:hypothetical protein